VPEEDQAAARSSSDPDALPRIRPVRWVPAREVLGSEAGSFTPWLADNLDALADAIGLTELNLVETESSVLEKRLDILATGIDDDGRERPVAVENQYGISNHDHLGKLVTYLAQQGRGLAVWVVEEYSEAHLAAVEFLNRTSVGEAGYVLVRVRFTAAAQDEYQVHFEVAARPNEFVRHGRRRAPSADEPRQINLEKKQYLADLLARIAQPLKDAGYRLYGMHRRGAYIHMRLPADLDVAAWSRLSVRATKTKVSVRLHLNGFESREENSAALDVLRDCYEKRLSEELPAPVDIDWHGGSAGADSDFAGVDLEGQGYRGGDVQKAAGWSVKVCSAWLSVMRSDLISDLRSQVEERVVATSEAPLDLDTD
jgi:hypothetical protein